MPIITSLSTRFFGHPRLMNPTLGIQARLRGGLQERNCSTADISKSAASAEVYSFQFRAGFPESTSIGGRQKFANKLALNGWYDRFSTGWRTPLSLCASTDLSCGGNGGRIAIVMTGEVSSFASSSSKMPCLGAE